MRKHILFALLLTLVLILFPSCMTTIDVQYMEPSKIDMSSYRTIMIAPTEEYRGSQNIPMYIRYNLDMYDYNWPVYFFYSTYKYDSINREAANEVTNMVNKVFASSSYYNVISNYYNSNYATGFGFLTTLKNNGVDALIEPKITSLKTDEYIDVKEVKDAYTGNTRLQYILYRYVYIAFSLTVTDTETGRIVAVRNYATDNLDYEIFDPEAFIFYTIMSEDQLLSDALSDKKSEIISDFAPRMRYITVTLKDNKPKNESVEEAYKAAENGNLDYALNLFLSAYETSSHVPSAYNASLILAARGDLERAISILSDLRSRGLDDKECDTLYSRLVTLKAKNDSAMAQYGVSSGE